METSFSLDNEKFRTQVRVPVGEWTKSMAENVVSAMYSRAKLAREKEISHEFLQQE